mmetsp:Transcript_19238/g.46834  ORF Transcript_19238/g.46834 Transcript_19238/m.46834 type:complete len:208 (+) Transcript_19238:166-789(+)
MRPRDRDLQPVLGPGGLDPEPHERRRLVVVPHQQVGHLPHGCWIGRGVGAEGVVPLHQRAVQQDLLHVAPRNHHRPQCGGAVPSTSRARAPWRSGSPPRGVGWAPGAGHLDDEIRHAARRGVAAWGLDQMDGIAKCSLLALRTEAKDNPLLRGVGEVSQHERCDSQGSERLLLLGAGRTGVRHRAAGIHPSGGGKRRETGRERVPVR